MKKYLLISSVLFSSIGFSQDREPGTIEIAPTIGLAVSQFLNYDDYFYSEPLFSSTIGVDFDYYFSSRWSLRSGLLYQIMGTDYYKSSGNYREKLDYLSVPVHANVHFGYGKNFHLNFGPTLGILMKGTQISSDGTEFNPDNYKPMQVALGVGFGHNFKVKENMGIGLELTQSFGLTNINKNYNGFYNYNGSNSFNSNSAVQNYYVNLSVRFVFTTNTIAKEID